MDRLDMPDPAPDVPLPDDGALSAVDQRIAVCCGAFAQTLRCIEGVSAQAARVLECHGDPAHLAALLGALDRLVTDAGHHSLALGSLAQARDCAGSA